MWHSGLSGSLISVAAFGVATAYVYHLIGVLTTNGLASLLGAALFATNANLLYMQSTPMVETLTILLTLGACFHLLRWTQTMSLLHFLASAGYVFAATLTRYETWALIPAGLAIVAVTSYQRDRDWGRVEGFTIAWGVLACYGIALWVIYNLVIFGNPLYFSTAPGAASSFADLAAADGLLPTKGDPVQSVSIFGWTIVDNIGLPLALAGAAGIIVLFATRTVTWPVKLAAVLPLSLVVFHLVSLTAGQSVVWSPHVSPHDFYNSRYGLLALPAVVIAASYLVTTLRSTGLALLAALLFLQLLALPSIGDNASNAASQAAGSQWADSNFPFLRAGQQITYVEALVLDEKKHHGAAEFLKEHGQESRVLISAQANGSAPLMFHSDLSLSQFISEGNEPYFREELNSPGSYVDIIVYQPGEPLDALKPMMDQGLPQSFRLAYEDGGFQIFVRTGDSVLPLELRGEGP
jgi:hypothetical protein